MLEFGKTAKELKKDRRRFWANVTKARANLDTFSRKKGRKAAAEKEEREMVINEASKQTLRSYVTKARENLDTFSRKKGRKSAADKATIDKRRAGLERAEAKLHAIRSKEFAERRENLLATDNKLDRHFERNHEPILKKHGFEKVHSANNINTYVHKHDNGHLSVVSIQYTPRTHDDRLYRGHRVEAFNTKGHLAVPFHPNPGVDEPQDHDEEKAKMLPRFENHIIDVKEKGSKEGLW